ncbi:hypothetical protein PI125_g19512 [Phytophthora idaei]|nr:hypothetical protein PI125_g19512 [Phytophthora idaei]
MLATLDASPAYIPEACEWLMFKDMHRPIEVDDEFSDGAPSKKSKDASESFQGSVGQKRRLRNCLQMLEEDKERPNETDGAPISPADEAQGVEVPPMGDKVPGLDWKCLRWHADRVVSENGLLRGFWALLEEWVKGYFAENAKGTVVASASVVPKLVFGFEETSGEVKSQDGGAPAEGVKTAFAMSVTKIQLPHVYKEA